MRPNPRWEYHGIVVPRGKAGSWDGAGIASPGAAVAVDGTVLVGWAGENAPEGGRNRGIGISTAAHPLGPFTKLATPVTCGGGGWGVISSHHASPRSSLHRVIYRP
jgi:hypothetical protein